MDVIPLIFVLILRTILNHSDAEGLASLYSEDAKILSPNRDLLKERTRSRHFGRVLWKWASSHSRAKGIITMIHLRAE